MKPKWQRARIVATHKDQPEMRGRELWVKIAPPFDSNLTLLQTGEIFRNVCCVYFNVITDDNELCGLPLEGIELLARGPEDFADDVPLVKWEDWLKETTPETKP